MQLGLIPPNSLSHMMEWTDFHLVVPDQLHDAANLTYLVEHLRGYTVLDNGAAEGFVKPLNWLDRMIASGFYNEVVAIDRLRDPAFSVAGARAMDSFKARWPEVKIMAVVQATSLAEIMKCVAAYTALAHIDVIGLPRVLNEQFGNNTRVALVESLSNDKDFGGKPIHCLGAHYDFPDEIRHLSRYPLVRSMDSSLPFVLGLYGLRFTDQLPQGLRRQTGYFQMIPDEEQKEAIEANVGTYINWAKAS